MTRVTWRRAAAVYLTVVALVIGSILVPEKAEGSALSRHSHRRWSFLLAHGGQRAAG